MICRRRRRTVMMVLAVLDPISVSYLAEADGNRTRPPAFTGALVLKTRRATRPQSPPLTNLHVNRD